MLGDLVTKKDVLEFFIDEYQTYDDPEEFVYYASSILDYESQQSELFKYADTLLHYFTEAKNM